MSDRLDAMSVLVAVVDAGSLSAAARSLGLPLTTVSRRISDLESRIGTTILNRSARGLTVTDQGTAYVAACRQILEEVDEAERTAAGEFSEPKGLLTLTAPIVFGRLHILPVLTDFLASYPDVTARLEQTDRSVNLQEEQIDAAIRIGHLPDSSLRARRLGEVRQVACASPSYLQNHGHPQTPEDLVSHSCVTFENLMPADRWSFGSDKSARQVPVNTRLGVNTAEAAIEAAASGLGITRVLSYQVSKAVKEGRLEIILMEDEPQPWPVNIIYLGRPVPQKLRSFIDFASPRLRSVLS
ncbi:LysR family transcriptional regulator [Cohaesibacter marisflavi]|uniref:LysR family transcriptional regulator n=1 Tax=Cohaesibacter marisflavi TaxID=655353 RepID=UPI0029C87182|nr:LysR family transcriptional regulator [Cohaesibacter marisflavi]